MTYSRTGLTDRTAQPLLIGIYCRISSDEEGRRLGVQRQEGDGRAYAARLGGTVVRVYVDNDISATTRSQKERPEYAEMMADVRAGAINCIVAYTSARLTRRPREAEDQIDLALELGAGRLYRYVSDIEVDLLTAAGRKHHRTSAGSNAGDADVISELATRAKVQAAADGVWRGGPRPFGFEAQCAAPRPAEAREVAAASEALLVGATLYGLVADLNKRGVTTAAGNRWDTKALRRVLCRAMNAGLIERYGEIVGEAQWEGIVPVDTLMAVRHILADPGRRTTTGPARRWVGTGVYVCGRHLLPTMHVKGAGGEPKYCCRLASHLTRRVEPVDDMVNRAIVKYLGKAEARDLLHRTQPTDTADLHVRRSAIRTRLDALARMFAGGQLDEQQLAEGSASGKADLREVEEKIASMSRGSVLSGLADAADPAAAWKASTLDRRRAVIQALMVVTILPARPGRPKTIMPNGSYFNPDTVDIDWRDWPE